MPWEGDPALLGVRRLWSLPRLTADGRRPWQKLWAGVDARRQGAANAK